jgi:hypothetical protein
VTPHPLPPPQGGRVGEGEKGYWMKKLFIITGIVAVLLVGGYLVLSFYAVKFVQTQLQKVIGPGFTATEIKIKPTYLSTKGIQYEDLHLKQRFFQIEELRIYPNPLSLLRGSLRIKEILILRPSFFFYRSREGVLIGPWVSMGKKEKDREISKEGEKKEGEPIHIKIDRFLIQKGSVDFEDRKIGEPPAQIGLRGLDFKINDIQYPFISTRSPVELKLKMRGSKKEGGLETKGWIDLKTMDMEVTLKVHEIEVKTFEPYYRKRVSAEIDTGYINMEAKIGVRKKMIDAPGEMELTDLRIKEEGTVFWIPAKSLLSLLKDRGNRIKVRFHVKGNMDDPQFKIEEAFLTRVAISLAGALGIPIKVVGETIFGGSGKGAEGLVEGLKSIEELFKKKKEKKR